MRSRSLVGVLAVTAMLIWGVGSARATGQSRRKPLDKAEQTVLLSLLKAVDEAQAGAASSDDDLDWSPSVLKSRNDTAYVPFTLTLNGPPDLFKSAGMYVRVVSRHDEMTAVGEHSFIRDALAHGGDVAPKSAETVFLGPGEMPIGGPGVSSSRPSIQGPSEASARLALQQKEFERQKAEQEKTKNAAETKRHDPLFFPFEDYYFLDVKNARGTDSRAIERALALPAGEYDVYIALADRTRTKNGGTTSVVKRRLTVPDFWNERLAVSSLMLVNEVRALNAPLAEQQQVERPYALGRVEMVPVASSLFASSDALSVALQICNYGAPDSRLTVEYAFYRIAGDTRQFFNATPPQHLGDGDLPKTTGWSTQAFTMQRVALNTFSPGVYELEITVRDHLTLSTATNTVTFTIR